MDNQAIICDLASPVLAKFYIGDYLDSLEDPDVEFELIQELIVFLALGGISLTKFMSKITKFNYKLKQRKSAPQQGNEIDENCGDKSSNFLV